MLEMVSHANKYSEISLPARSVSYSNYFFYSFSLLWLSFRFFVQNVYTRLSSTVCLVKISNRTKLIFTENLNRIVDLLSVQLLCSSFPIWVIGITKYSCFLLSLHAQCPMAIGLRGCLKSLYQFFSQLLPLKMIAITKICVLQWFRNGNKRQKRCRMVCILHLKIVIVVETAFRMYSMQYSSIETHSPNNKKTVIHRKHLHFTTVNCNNWTMPKVR